MSSWAAAVVAGRKRPHTAGEAAAEESASNEPMEGTSEGVKPTEATTLGEAAASTEDDASSHRRQQGTGQGESAEGSPPPVASVEPARPSLQRQRSQSHAEVALRSSRGGVTKLRGESEELGEGECGAARPASYEPPRAAAAPSADLVPTPPPLRMRTALHDDVVEWARWCARAVYARVPFQQAAFFRVLHAVRGIWGASSGLMFYGSLMSGLALPSSDIDMVVLGVAPAHGMGAARRLEQRLRADEAFASLINVESATMPVIKAVYQEAPVLPGGAVRLDITFENPHHRGLRTVGIVMELCRLLGELRPLALVLKQLLVDKELADPFLGGLSSYALVLLSAAFLVHIRERRGLVDLAGEPLLVDHHDAVRHREWPVNDLGVLLIALLRFLGSALDTRQHCVRFTQTRKSVGMPSFAHMAELPQRAGLMAADPVVILDPLDERNNIGRSCYRVAAVQKTFADAASLLELSLHAPAAARPSPAGQSPASDAAAQSGLLPGQAAREWGANHLHALSAPTTPSMPPITPLAQSARGPGGAAPHSLSLPAPHTDSAGAPRAGAPLQAQPALPQMRAEPGGDRARPTEWQSRQVGAPFPWLMARRQQAPAAAGTATAATAGGQSFVSAPALTPVALSAQSGDASGQRVTPAGPQRPIHYPLQQAPEQQRGGPPQWTGPRFAVLGTVFAGPSGQGGTEPAHAAAMPPGLRIGLGDSQSL